MNSEWERCTLDKLVLLQRGHDLSTSKRGKGNIPVAGSNGIVGFHDKSKGIVPGVTIGRSGSIGNTQFFDSEYFPLNTTLYVTDFLGNYPKFVYYFFKRFDFSAFDSGSVQPSLNRNFLYTAIIDKPGLSDQKAIAHILGTLDEKIQLNKKNNETLEDIAKALFKSWFIDFDPVKAKKGGSLLGLSKDISDLFADSFEDSIFGEIPQSWKVSKFGKLCTPKRGKVITKKTIITGKIPVIAGGLNPAYYHSKSNASSPVVTISASGNAGYVNLYYEDIWASDCSYINKNVTDFIYFAHSFLKFNQNKIYHLRHGAVQQHINPNDLMGLDFVFPPVNLINKYELIVTPLHNKISNNLNEINTLFSLKELLLRELISGKLRVPDAEKMIEEIGI